MHLHTNISKNIPILSHPPPPPSTTVIASAPVSAPLPPPSSMSKNSSGSGQTGRRGIQKKSSNNNNSGNTLSSSYHDRNAQKVTGGANVISAKKTSKWKPWSLITTIAAMQPVFLRQQHRPHRRRCHRFDSSAEAVVVETTTMALLPQPSNRVHLLDRLISHRALLPWVTRTTTTTIVLPIPTEEESSALMKWDFHPPMESWPRISLPR